MPITLPTPARGTTGAEAALLFLLATVWLGYTALAAAPLEPPALPRFDPSKPLAEAERVQRLEHVRRGLTAEQVRQLLGVPRQVARQILYQRYFEQWLYGAPFYLRVEFECPSGRQAQVQSVRGTQASRP